LELIHTEGLNNTRLFRSGAFALSLFSAYNQYLKFEVGLSIGWSNWEDGPAKEISRNGVNGYNVTHDITSTFMNTGNVPLLIYAIDAIGRQDVNGCADVFHPKPVGYAFTFATVSTITKDGNTKFPIVSRPGEIMIVPLRIQFDLFDDKNGGRSSILKDKQYGFTYCVRTQVYDTRRHLIVAPVNNVWFRFDIIDGKVGPSAGQRAPEKVI